MPRTTENRPLARALLAGAAAVAIFLVDTLSPLPFAVAVLYVRRRIDRREPSGDGT